MPENESNDHETLVAEGVGDNLVDIKLAHPLSRRDLQNFGLPKDSLTRPNTIVRVRRDHAAAIIGAGYAQVDPEDNTAVRKALAGSDADVSKSAEAPDAGEGTTSDVAPAGAAVGDDAGDKAAPAEANTSAGNDAAVPSDAKTTAVKATPAKGK